MDMELSDENKVTFNTRSEMSKGYKDKRPSLFILFKLHHLKVLPLVSPLKTNSLLPNYQLISNRSDSIRSVINLSTAIQV